jgi:tRNA uridine 5-carboxymethylaminomethyl modification enzyme
MFTSRAEYRLHLRIDNAGQRLTPHGRKLGLVDDAAWAEFEERERFRADFEALLHAAKPRAEQLQSSGLGELTSVAGLTWAQLLKRPQVNLEPMLPVLAGELRARPALAELAAAVESGGVSSALPNQDRAVETSIKFAGYLEQQKKSIEKMKAAESAAIPAWLDYSIISGLSREMKEKLERVRPATIGQASRIPGVTPAAVSLIHISIRIQAAKQAV